MTDEPRPEPTVDPATGVSQETPPPSATGPHIPGAAGNLGDRIGPYRLVQQLGEGGMGTVFLAEQTNPVQRQVALKVVKAGLDSRQIVARFEAERQALALMDHPNVAKVHDAGATDAGHPFFVMELVQGKPLTHYCDEQRLTVRQRLELFVPVCRAVQHAHQKGIIHRDLKPSNVLVGLYDGQPVPKVIDFGVAKATGGQLPNQTLITGFGAVVGTLEYMSPEQAEPNQLDVDTRADIYALGAMLYQLLTGSTPLGRQRLKGASLMECLRLIREEEPPKPSTRLSAAAELPSLAAQRGLEPRQLRRQVQGDLDWIVMKCLEKDRERRYDTANGLALDVHRYLADEPVLASPPSALYRLRKFARRHKAGLLTTTAAVLVLLLAGSGVGWVWWDWSARRTATDQTAILALMRAEIACTDAERLPARDEAEAHARVVEWQKAAAAVAEADAALKTGTGTEGLQRRVADTRERIERGKAQALVKENLFHGLDEARLALVTWVESRFDYAGVAAKYFAAFEAYGLKVKPGATQELARRIRAEDPAIRAALLMGLDDWTDAAFIAQTTPSAGELRALATAANDDPWRKRLWQATAAHDWTTLRAGAGMLAAAVRAAQIANQQRATLRDLSVEARRSSLPPSSLEYLARRLFDAGAHAEAVDLLRLARQGDPADFWIHFDLGAYLATDPKKPSPPDLDEGIGCYRTALALRPKATAVYNNLGIALAAKHQLDDAIAQYDKAIALDPQFANAHVNLGKALAAKKQWDDAITEYNKAIALDPKFAWVHANVGVALAHKKQWDDAIAEYNKAIALDSKKATTHYNLGVALAAKHQLDDAIAEFNNAIALDPKHADSHMNLGVAFYEKTQLDYAIAEFNKAIALAPNDAETHYSLGVVLVDKKQSDDAIAEYNKAIALDPKHAQAHCNLGLVLAGKEQLDDAIAEFQKAIAIDPNIVQAHLNLGQALLQKGRFAEAKSSVQQGLKLLPNKAPLRANGLRQLHQCDVALALEAKLANILAGKAQPVDRQERVDLIEICRFQQRNVDAAKLCADAFAADIKLATDLIAGHRYNAACFAALAAAGQGKDADKLDDKERARLRKQAVEWLRADLALWTKEATSDKPGARTLVQKTLQHWQDDSDLASIRDNDAVAKLPADEREACQKLWADVAELLRTAGDAK